jgi:Raf kinase inhibitor-like YbhB/YbcL family protein
MTFALVMHDPDAPVGDWVHWVAWNIPASSRGMDENFPRQEQLTNGTRQGRNSFGKSGYNGPCPPPGTAHRYFFRVYALDTKLDLQAGATRADLDSALKGHILAEAEFMGTYRR